MILVPDSALPIVALGVGGAAAVALIGRALGRGRAHASAIVDGGAVIAAATAPTDPAAWVFPVPTLGTRAAEISDGWASRRYNSDGSRRLHLGSDLMYRRRTRADLIEWYPPGTPHGTAGYFMPDDVPALAAGPGVVTFAEKTPRGGTVKLRHAGGWVTYYTHLSSVAVVVGTRVAAGQPIGVVGFDPTDKRRLMHLHFELWRGDRSGVTNAAPYLAAWSRRTIASWASPARNGRGLTYRPIGSSSERYPDWLREHKGSSGVYVIRERSSAGKPVVVYVGQSQTGKLYETLTRHFQQWRRSKGYWRGQYAEGHDPGLTFDRNRVEVAVRVTDASDALDEEARLIRRLRPRDNILGQPEDVPF